MLRDTVSIHFVRSALTRLCPSQREHALAQAGIAPALLHAPHARVTAQAFAALWLATGQLLDDEFFGLDRRRMKVGSFALLAQACISTRTLEEALQRMLGGWALLLDELQASLQRPEGPHPKHAAQSSGWAEIRLHNQLCEPRARRFAEETLLVQIHGLASWLTGQRLPIARAEFAYPAPEHADEYLHMYSSTLRFDAPHTGLYFDASLLSASVVQTPESLRGFLNTAPQSVFVKYRNHHSSSARIRRLLRASVGQPDWPVMAAVALRFGVSVATLRRQLMAERSSFQALKDEVRRDAAIHLLCESTQTVSSIACALGFQEVSAFRRAFKGWSSVQPSEYRARAQAAALHEGMSARP